VTLLNRYLFKLFTKNLLLVLSGFCSIYLLVDFFERIDNFMEKNLPFSLAAKYFFLKTPLIVEQLMPVSIMLAGIIAIGLLHHNRELLSLQAAGISVARTIRPTVVAAFFFILLGLASSQWLVPATQSTVNRIWFQDVKNLFPTGILRSGLVYYRGSQGFYTMGLPSGEDRNTFAPFSYVKWNKSFDFERLLVAQKAGWQNGAWLLSNGIEKRPAGDGQQIQAFKEERVTLPEGPDVLLAPPYKEETMSLTNLYDQMFSGNQQERKNASLKLQEKISYIFLGIPLLLIGLPVLLVICRKMKKDLSLAIPISCLLSFIVWGIWGVLQSLAKTGYLPVFLAAWLIHMVFIASGIMSLRRLSRT